MQIEKRGSYWFVSGKITTHPKKIANEYYCMTFRTKSKAEADHAKWTKIENDLIVYRAEERARRIEIAKAYIAERSTRPVQLQLSLF